LTPPPHAPRTIFGRPALRRLRALYGAARRGVRAPATESDAGLALVICGVEHSGTTLLSDLFRQVPGWGAGFETGVLLADTPADFPMVDPHFASFAANWRLSDADLAELCAAPDFAGFYRRLAAKAGVLPPGTLAIFDKTPRYMLALKDCLGRVPAPFIATYKDPRAILHSGWVRAGRPSVLPWLDEVEAERLGYLLSLYEQHQLHRMERRVLFVSLESLCLAAGQSCGQAFEHAGLAFDPAYLMLRGIENRATHGSTIQAGVPFAYRHDWPPDILRVVERRFAALDGWFYG
jgi:hypothetical protein